jgi:hypothetical protein
MYVYVFQRVGPYPTVIIWAEDRQRAEYYISQAETLKNLTFTEDHWAKAKVVPSPGVGTSITIEDGTCSTCGGPLGCNTCHNNKCICM